jgi:hypothetical protein
MLTLHLLTVKYLLMGKIQGMLRWEYPVPSVKEATWTFFRGICITPLHRRAN